MRAMLACVLVRTGRKLETVISGAVRRYSSISLPPISTTELSKTLKLGAKEMVRHESRRFASVRAASQPELPNNQSFTRRISMNRSIPVSLMIAAGLCAMFPVLSSAQRVNDGGAVFVMTNDADKNEVIAYD